MFTPKNLGYFLIGIYQHIQHIYTLHINLQEIKEKTMLKNPSTLAQHVSTQGRGLSTDESGDKRRIAMKHILEKAIFEATDEWLTSPPDPREQIRAGAKAQLNEKLLTIDVDTGHAGYIYDVDLERCNTPAEVLDWIFQVKQKTWCTPEIIFDLLPWWDESYS